MPAPLYFVGPGQINFIVPWKAPTTGTADVQVIRVSTGQLLAASPIAMNNVSPGGFRNPSAGSGAKLAAVINQDGTVNDATHPAKRGEYISIYATGQGPVSSPPADGDIPRNGLVSSQGTPRVFIGSDFTDQVTLQGTEQRNANGDVNFVAFSGLSPSFPECGRSTCESPWRPPRDRPRWACYSIAFRTTLRPSPDTASCST